LQPLRIFHRWIIFWMWIGTVPQQLKTGMRRSSRAQRFVQFWQIRFRAFHRRFTTMTLIFDAVMGAVCPQTPESLFGKMKL